MGNDIAHFKLFSDHIQSSAECNAVDVIYESFIITGDQDYLMSRLLALNGLPRGFYWAAAQTIEKYLKAFLLMNGKSVKNFKHFLIKIFEAACEINEDLKNLDIQPHPSIRIESAISQYLKRFNILDFLADIDKYGNPNNRYSENGIEYNTGHLFALDSFAYHLRKKIGVVPISESIKKLSPDLIAILNKNNPWVDTQFNQTNYEIPTREFSIKDSMSVTKLDILKKNRNIPAYKLALDWLDMKMKI